LKVIKNLIQESWKDAREFCRKNGMDLPIVKNVEKIKDIAAAAPTKKGGE